MRTSITRNEELVIVMDVSLTSPRSLLVWLNIEGNVLRIEGTGTSQYNSSHVAENNYRAKRRECASKVKVTCGTVFGQVSIVSFRTTLPGGGCIVCGG